MSLSKPAPAVKIPRNENFCGFSLGSFTKNHPNHPPEAVQTALKALVDSPTTPLLLRPSVPEGVFRLQVEILVDFVRRNLNHSCRFCIDCRILVIDGRPSGCHNFTVAGVEPTIEAIQRFVAANPISDRRSLGLAGKINGKNKTSVWSTAICRKANSTYNTKEFIDGTFKSGAHSKHYMDYVS